MTQTITNPDKPKAKRHPVSAELQTMAKIDRIMAELDDDEANLVYVWFVQKFDQGHAVPPLDMTDKL